MYYLFLLASKNPLQLILPYKKTETPIKCSQKSGAAIGMIDQITSHDSTDCLDSHNRKRLLPGDDFEVALPGTMF